MTEAKQADTRSFLDLVLQGRPFEGKWVRLAVLALGCAGIPLWQHSFARKPSALDATFKHKASSGLHYELSETELARARRTIALAGDYVQGVQAPLRFIYFYHYLGLYPVASELAPSELDYSREGAEKLLATRGDTLVMEIGHTVRSAEPGQMLLYLPDVWLRGDVRRPRVRTGHGIVFAAALVALFVTFWAVRQPLLGFLLVAFLGSNPCQLYEVYFRENVFGWMITTGVLLLALHLPLMQRRRPHRLLLWAAPLATGLLLATVRQIRPEPVAMIVSAALCCLLVAGVRWRVRAALVLVLLVSFCGAATAWELYFERLYGRALVAVKAAGGHPYTGPRQQYHMGWHNVWCGLGDFDRKYGYEWNDNLAKDYARPILAERYHEIMGDWNWYTGASTDQHWDEAKKYYKMPHELPHYVEVVRSKVLHDIRHDPLWYLDILLRRAGRILSETTPVSVSWGGSRLGVPVPGALIIPLAVILVAIRGWPFLKLVAFLIPLSFPALLVYSARGMCHYSCYHLAAAAVSVCLLLEAGLWLGWRKRSRNRPRRPRKEPSP